MRLFLFIGALAALVGMAAGWSPFGNTASIWSTVSWSDAGPVGGAYPGDAGGQVLDGGDGIVLASQPFTARSSSTSVHQSEVCYADIVASPTTINVSLQPQGSVDLGASGWFNIGSPCVLSVDAGYTINGACGFDLTSGYPFQRVVLTNSGSDAGWVSCNVAAL